jgi:hypothetical protein
MTGLVIHQCPRCELRFSFRTELEYHLSNDHPSPRTPGRAQETGVDSRPNLAAPQPVAPAAAQPSARRRTIRAPRAQLAALLLAVVLVSVLLVTFAAVSVSLPTAFFTGVFVLALSGFSLRRVGSHARLSRR